MWNAYVASEGGAEASDQPGSSGCPGGGRVRPGVAGGVPAGPWDGNGDAGTGEDDDGDTVNAGLAGVGEVVAGLPTGVATGVPAVGRVALGVAVRVGVGGSVSWGPGTFCSLMGPVVGLDTGDAPPVNKAMSFLNTSLHAKHQDTILVITFSCVRPVRQGAIWCVSNELTLL